MLCNIPFAGLARPTSEFQCSMFMLFGILNKLYVPFMENQQDVDFRVQHWGWAPLLLVKLANWWVFKMDESSFVPSLLFLLGHRKVKYCWLLRNCVAWKDNNWRGIGNKWLQNDSLCSAMCLGSSYHIWTRTLIISIFQVDIGIHWWPSYCHHHHYHHHLQYPSGYRNTLMTKSSSSSSSSSSSW